MRWNDTKVAELKRLVAEGELAFSVIATKLGCTRSAALGKAQRLGLLVENNPRRKVKAKADAKAPTPKVRGTPYTPKPLSEDKPKPSPKKKLKAKPKARRNRLPAELHDDEVFNRYMEYLDNPVSHKDDIVNIPGPYGCKWISGDVMLGKARWCRLPVAQGSSWCATHRDLVYAPASTYTRGNLPKRFKKGKYL